MTANAYQSELGRCASRSWGAAAAGSQSSGSTNRSLKTWQANRPNWKLSASIR
jgi:hypothetical protein